MMKEKPILFGTEMVNAILSGRKTQTRRVVKYPPFDVSDDGIDIAYAAGNLKCPYGQPGDELWVRETWRTEENENSIAGIRYRAGNTFIEIENSPEASSRFCEVMRFDQKWRPSIFMPRWASRIQLTVKDVRVERVQDIIPSGYRAEGIKISYPAKMRSYLVEPMFKQRWIDLWDSINKKRGYGWDVNPWVWVIEFEVKS